MATEFQKEVWEALKLIPRGRVTTYGALARYLGRPGASRAVGSAVGKNPDAPAVPCHRVVLSDGRIGNYSGKGGRLGKIRLLESEGLEFENGGIVEVGEKLFLFDRGV